MYWPKYYGKDRSKKISWANPFIQYADKTAEQRVQRHGIQAHFRWRSWIFAMITFTPGDCLLNFDSTISEYSQWRTALILILRSRNLLASHSCTMLGLFRDLCLLLPPIDNQFGYLRYPSSYPDPCSWSVPDKAPVTSAARVLFLFFVECYTHAECYYYFSHCIILFTTFSLIFYLL